MMHQTVDHLLTQTLQDIVARRRFPGATYRLQFHAGFTFRAAAALTAYLRDLGITHCYASPYLKARPGSQHGYDIIDHRVLNPEIGTDADYAAFVEALHAHGLGQILDMVPNHMGVVGNDNPWWNDVLENGPVSPYASYFDIAWFASPRPELQGRVLLPVLGEPYGKVLESQQIQLTYAAGTFALSYFDHRWPVAPRSYGMILGHRLEELERSLPADDPALVEYQSILTALKHLPLRTETDPAKITERQREKEVIKRRLASLTQDSAPVREFLEKTVQQLNGTAGDSRSFDPLDELLDDQAYRLCFWRVASDEINYRRFFDVNELAALSMEREDVFDATHDLVLRLLLDGKIDGLRIDHPDGLFDPKAYLTRLQVAFVFEKAMELAKAQPDSSWVDLEVPLYERIHQWGREQPEGWAHWPLYVLVEKILGPAEALPADWPTHGTSGYDFLALVNSLFVDAANAEVFTRLYRDWLQEDTPFPEMVYRKKFSILQEALSSELHTLAYQLDRLAQQDRWSRDFTLHSLRHALREVIACFPVYRSYISEGGVHESDRKHVLRAVQRAKARNPALSRAYFHFIRDMLLLKYRDAAGEDERAEQRRFAGKFQQVTSPVMAKGVEDTSFYIYNRLLSLNEVGGDPGRFGLPPAALHHAFQERQARWPWAMSATSTHDTKRSEDVRARLNVLSEMPQQWRECLYRWSKLNEPHRVTVDEATAPDANEEYFLYQTLVGAWPLEPYGPEEFATFVRRVQDYLHKALHEAKVHSSWINPDPAYDDAIRQYVERILNPEMSQAFVEDMRAFVRQVSHFGLVNSLAQTLVKITAPGVPDLYQGCELWDFSLVDPDNRRPVDYARRQRLLAELQARTAAGSDLTALARELAEAKQDGRVKLYLTTRGLHCRRDHPELFTTGDYLPLEAVGPRAEQVFAFARRQGERWAVVAVPRLLCRAGLAAGALPVGQEFWQDTCLVIPDLPSGTRLGSPLTGESVMIADRDGRPCLSLAEVFASFPVALYLK